MARSNLPCATFDNTLSPLTIAVCGTSRTAAIGLTPQSSKARCWPRVGLVKGGVRRIIARIFIYIAWKLQLTLTIDTILVRDKEPVPATIDNNVVLLSIRAGSYFDFNRVGSDIWNMLAEPHPVRKILDTLSQTYDVDADTLTRDVTAFLQRLVDVRLVQILEPGKAR